MATTTTLARTGVLSYDVQINGWCAYVNHGGYTSEQQVALVGALMDAQRGEFNSLLPEGCVWYPETGEVIGPVDADLSAALDAVRPRQREDALDDAMEMACERVIARFDEIERKALAQ
jgi:hypothetical protein